MAVGSRARLALAGGAQEGGFETCADVRSSQHTPTVEREVHLPRGRSATPARSRCGDNRSAAPAARRSPRARTGRPRGLVVWAETPVPLSPLSSRLSWEAGLSKSKSSKDCA